MKYSAADGGLVLEAQDKFDAVVIGSGFGGSVAAWRLKRAHPHARILVLERGMPYPPRSFARTPHELRQSFWDPASALYGLYELWSFEHAKVLVASGLGGGSLIYANVMLEKPAHTFEADWAGGTPWPIKRPQLAAHYEEAKRMLGATPLPTRYRTAGPEGSTSVPKTDQFIQAATAAGLRAAQPAELAISFAGPAGDAQPGAPLGADNLHHRERRTCTLVGECDLGCNEGAKNSLDYTYLSAFHSDGGEIRTCCEAVDIASSDDGYEVRYLQHLAARANVEARARADGKQSEDRRLLDPSDAPVRHVRATVVVVAAGTLGSTRLLLSSRAVLPPLSPRLGAGFSSNGDLLTVARDCTDPGDELPRNLAPSRGPVITAYAEGNELWVEDAGGPAWSEWAWQVPETPRDLWAMRRDLVRIACGKVHGRIGAYLARALGTTRSSSAMLPMLTMGRDNAGGRFRLEHDALALDWDPEDSRGYFDDAEQATAGVATALGGRLGPGGLLEHNRGLTVHPLGGCPMGASAGEGVVGPDGEVFGCTGLFVADGSVMPSPVGPNPSLTIAAIAGHIANAAADRVRM